MEACGKILLRASILNEISNFSRPPDDEGDVLGWAEFPRAA
jgi:hypothetical protein